VKPTPRNLHEIVFLAYEAQAVKVIVRTSTTPYS
jgi:hypothetical protein